MRAAASRGRLSIPVRPASHAAALWGLAAAVVAVSFSGVLIRLADAGAATVVLLRMVFALLLLSPVIARDAARGRLPRTRRERGVIALSGAFLAAHLLTWTASLAYTSVASSVLLVCTHPVLVALTGRRILGERVSPRLWTAIVLSLAGVAVTTGGDVGLGGRQVLGDLLALAGAVTVTGYLLIGRSVSGRYGLSGYSAPCYAIAAVASVIAAPLTGSSLAPSWRTVLACLGLGAVCTVGGHTVLNWTLGRLRAATVSLALLGEPPLTALLAIPLLGELPRPATVVGGAIILVGIAVAMREQPDGATAPEVGLSVEA